jgi:hypothetical protein
MRDGDNPGFYEPLKKNKYRLFNPKQKSESSKSKLVNIEDNIYPQMALCKRFDVRKDNVIGIIIKGPTLSRLFRID